ncbi:MAG: hypothetical protein AB8B73_06970 [Ekhidna sp.]
MLKYKLLILLTLLSYQEAFTQNIEKPSEGKSLVYFVRSAGTGALINFKYFDGEKYIGKFNGVNYLKYECDPGEHIFWVTAENRSFLQGKLEKNKTYMVEVRPQMGAIKARVLIKPITDDKKKQKALKLISKKDAIDLNADQVAIESEKLQFYIENGMDKYKRDLDKGVIFEILQTATMN